MKRIHYILFGFIVLLITSCNQQSDVYDITSYGAVAGEKHINTSAIQAAINTCSQSGGGKVIIPAGTFYSGSLELLSNVHLYLETGAILKGSTNIEDFNLKGRKRGLLFAFNQKSITISGDGEVCGNGTRYHDSSRPHNSEDFDRQYIRQGDDYMAEGFDFSDGPIWKDIRPGMTVVFINCEDVNIRDICISDTPSWALKIGYCDNVIVHGLTIMNNLLVPNSDGIHCAASRNVCISDCDIRAGDDAIIVTSLNEDEEIRATVSDTATPYGSLTNFAENIVVSNCVLQSRSAGIRVGYGEFPIRNCIFSNLVIYDSNRGLGVFARDGVTIENILFTDIIIRNRIHSGHWWGNGEPIHVSTVPQNEGIAGGDLKNIRFNNIIADSETGIIVWGSEYNRIKDIQFHNVQLNIHKSKLDMEYGGNIDLRPSFPDSLKIFSFDLPGMYIQQADDISIRDFKLTWDEDVAEYFTHGIHLKDVTGFYIDNQSKYPSRPGSNLPAKKEE